MINYLDVHNHKLTFKSWDEAKEYRKKDLNKVYKSYYVNHKLNLLTYNRHGTDKIDDTYNSIEEAVAQKRKEINNKLDKLLEPKYLYYVNDDFLFIQIDESQKENFDRYLLAENPQLAIKLKLAQIETRLVKTLTSLSNKGILEYDYSNR